MTNHEAGTDDTIMIGAGVGLCGGEDSLLAREPQEGVPLPTFQP